MAKGRPGFMIEGFKFTLYLGIPALASWYFSDPTRMRQSADYWKMIEYPANPTTGLKERILEQDRIHREQREQRQAIREQLKRLDQMANTSNSSSAEENEEESSNSGFWSNLVRFGRKKAE